MLIKKVLREWYHNFPPHVMTKEERIGWYISTARKVNFQLAQTGGHFNQLIS